MPRPLRHIYSILVVVIGWVFFRAPDISYAFEYLGSMLFINGVANQMPIITIATLVIFAISIIGCMPIIPKSKSLIDNAKNKKLPIVLDVLSWTALVIIFLVCIPMILSGATSPFIYAQF
jgi:alginate O-acetyltransferase complex protein AlgI